MPSFDSARHIAVLSIMLASQGLLVVSQQLPISGYSLSTATPTSTRGRVHMSPRNAAGDSLIDIVAAELLAHKRQHECRVLLHIDRIMSGEAENYMLWQSVVKRNGDIRPLGLAELSVRAQALPERIGRVGDHAVERIKVCSERFAAVAFDPLIYHHWRGEICRQPTVFPKSLCDAHGIVHDEISPF